MGRPRGSWYWLLCLSFVLVACSTPPEPTLWRSAQLDRGYAGRVWFLPPVGAPKPHGAFDGELDLTIAVFNVDPATGVATGPALPPALATADGSIDRHAGGYQANWKVDRTASDPAASAYLRLEVRRAGAPEGPACNALNRDCLGSLEVRLVADNGKAATAGTPAGFLNVVRTKTLPLRFLVRSLAGTVPASISELASVGSGAPLDEAQGNCAAGEFDTPGQGLQAIGAGLQAIGAGLQAIGAVGGVFTGPDEVFEGRTVTTEQVAAELAASAGFDPDHKVAILVVDDFHGAYRLPSELTQPRADLDLAALVAAGAVSHGALVFHQVLDLVDALSPGERVYGRNGNTDEPLATFAAPDPYHDPILVQALDTGGLDTDAMAERIRLSLEYLSGTLRYKRVVVNMSFAVVPCAIRSDFGLAGVTTFEQYVSALGLVNDIPESLEGELKQLVTTPVDLEHEPLFAYLACPIPTAGSARCDGSSGAGWPLVEAMVHVAASGNLGLDFPMYPAAWPSVVAVGSQDVTAGSPGIGYSAARSAFSNVADVLAPGALFELASATGTTVAYAGTSFSAPVVSVFQALDLGRDHPRCAPGSLAVDPVAAPELAPGAYADVPLLTAGGDASPALTTYCIEAD